MNEYVDLYDAQRVKTNQSLLRGKAVPSGTFRLLVHVCIFNQKGEMLIQQRQNTRKKWANLWDLSVGGAASVGENSLQAAQRELKEELGITHDFSVERPFFTIHTHDGFDDVFVIKQDIDLDNLTLQTEEVKCVMWANKEQVLALRAEGKFIEYHEEFLSLLFALKERGVHKNNRYRTQ